MAKPIWTEEAHRREAVIGSSREITECMAPPAGRLPFRESFGARGREQRRGKTRRQERAMHSGKCSNRIGSQRAEDGRGKKGIMGRGEWVGGEEWSWGLGGRMLRVEGEGKEVCCSLTHSMSFRNIPSEPQRTKGSRHTSLTAVLSPLPLELWVLWC